MFNKISLNNIQRIRYNKRVFRPIKEIGGHMTTSSDIVIIVLGLLAVMFTMVQQGQKQKTKRVRVKSKYRK